MCCRFLHTHEPPDLFVSGLIYVLCCSLKLNFLNRGEERDKPASVFILVLILVWVFLQGEAPGGVSGSEGEHQGEACWLRLPQDLQEVPQQVKTPHTHSEVTHGVQESESDSD